MATKGSPFDFSDPQGVDIAMVAVTRNVEKLLEYLVKTQDGGRFQMLQTGIGHLFKEAAARANGEVTDGE
ncbi:MAG: hypothetical protein RBT11_17895 [Desulfobacterales bacterium]|nr:hypothetical protein [Desulfobacterales bacterium]